MLVLEVIRGVDHGRIFPLPPGEPQLLGRSSEALPLTDRSVSRRHAELTPDGDDWWLSDLKSANGIWVNGCRVEDRVILREGDEISCGQTVLRFTRAERLISGPAARADQTPELPPVGTVAIGEKNIELPRTLEAAQARLRLLETLSSLAISTTDSVEIIDRSIDMLVSQFNPSSIFVLNKDDNGMHWAPVGRRHQDLDRCQAIVDRVQQTGRPLLVIDAQQDDRFREIKSVQDLGLRSVMAVPLEMAGSLFGVIVLDDREQPSVWDEEDIRLLTAVGRQLSLAIINANVAIDQIRQARLVSMGETVATISHAVKNIMQGLRGGAGAVELAIARGDLELASEAWPILARNLDRIHDLTFNMLAWSRSASLELESIQIGPIVQEVIDLLGVSCRHRKVSITMEGHDDLTPVPVDASAFHQAVLNLLTNAIEAVSAKTGRILVSLSQDEEAQWLNCVVQDNGDGVAPDRHIEIFQPFTSTKGQRGTGLGLAVTRKIAREHGGDLILDQAFQDGARFLLRLPMDRDGDPGDTDSPGPGDRVRNLNEFDS
ncbi:MAG: ATP-binding protein [Phycisphaerales bacterium]|nr:ATP-binding protein [Phycisphaerales bacterium]